MCAYMVSKVHIDLLMRVALEGPKDNHSPSGCRWSGPRVSYQENLVRRERADAAGQMLVTTNLASIHARYPDTIDNPKGTPGPIDQYWLREYRYEAPRRHLTAVEAFKALACYEYQACEHDGWEASRANRFCNEFRECLIATLPGYSDASWSLDEEDAVSA